MIISLELRYIRAGFINLFIYYLKREYKNRSGKFPSLSGCKRISVLCACNNFQSNLRNGVNYQLQTCWLVFGFPKSLLFLNPWVWPGRYGLKQKKDFSIDNSRRIRLISTGVFVCQHTILIFVIKLKLLLLYFNTWDDF